MLCKIVEGLGGFFQIMNLHPPFHSRATPLQAGLNVHEQIDTSILFQINFLFTAWQLGLADALLQSFQRVIAPQRAGAGKTLLALGTKFQNLFALNDLIALLPHSFQKFVKCLDRRQYPVNIFPQEIFPTLAGFLCRPLRIVLAFFLWFFNDIQAKFPAYPVIRFPQREKAVFHIVELVGAVQSSAVKFDVIMDMLLIHMGRHNELMFSSGKIHRQFISQLIGVLRRDGSRLKGLDNQIRNHVLIGGTFAPGGGGINLFGHCKFLPCCIWGTLIASNQ